MNTTMNVTRVSTRNSSDSSLDRWTAGLSLPEAMGLAILIVMIEIAIVLICIYMNIEEKKESDDIELGPADGAMEVQIERYM